MDKTLMVRGSVCGVVAEAAPWWLDDYKAVFGFVFFVVKLIIDPGAETLRI